MSSSRIWLGIAVLSIGLFVSAQPAWRVSAAGAVDKATVRLYSNGQVVGEWEASGAGRLEGDTLVFPVRRGVRDVEVRIRGTYSYEAHP